MAQQNLGGITIKEVVTFQTQIMMGAQFGRIANKQATKKEKEKDLLIACLRMGWNDAFRHTSRNTKDGDVTVLEAEENKRRKKSEGHKEPYDDVICVEILNRDVLLNTFVDFACATSTAAKIEIVESRYDELKKIFAPYKEIDGDKRLCFGHFQKMFNIAIKLYVCLYVCREWLEIDEGLFVKEILDNIQNADCPIDSIILGKVAAIDESKRGYRNHKWSKYGTDDYPTKDYYGKVQDEISNAEATKGNSRLYYDFVAWKQ